MLGNVPPVSKMPLDGCTVTQTWRAAAQRVWGARGRLRIWEGVLHSPRYLVLEVSRDLVSCMALEQRGGSTAQFWRPAEPRRSNLETPLASQLIMCLKSGMLGGAIEALKAAIR